MSDANQSIVVDAVESAVDEILGNEESILTDDPTFDDSTFEQGPTIPETLVEKAKSLGLSAEDIPQDISESAISFVQKAVEKADERVRGFQSGFDRRSQELAAKAQAYEALTGHPEFRRFLELRQSGALADVTPAKKELDVANLPADPMEKLKYVVNFILDERIGQVKSELDTKVQAVGKATLDNTWASFVATHPDAPNYANDMGRLIRAGYSLEDSYRVAKNASFDPDQLRDQVLEQVKQKVQDRKRVSGSVLSQNRSGASRTGSDLVALAKEKGTEAAILEAIARAEREVSGA